MILELFIVLITVAIILIALGYYMDMSELSVVGFVFLFILSSFVLLPRNLELKTGEQVITNSTISNITTSQISYTYEKYNDNTTHYIGYFLSIISALGMIFIIIRMIYGGKY